LRAAARYSCCRTRLWDASPYHSPDSTIGSIYGLARAKQGIRALFCFLFRALGGEPYRVDRRETAFGRRPRIAAVLRDPQAAAGRAEGKRIAVLRYRERVAQHQIVGVALRQTLGQHVEALAA